MAGFAHTGTPGVRIIPRCDEPFGCSWSRRVLLGGGLEYLLASGFPLTRSSQAGRFPWFNFRGVMELSIATSLPPPSVLGGSCVTFNDVALPLLQTSANQIQAQIPTTVTTGTNVVQVISLATGLQSTSAVVTVQAATGSGNSNNSGSPAINNGAGKNHITPSEAP